MKRLSRGLLATVMMTVGLVGVAQAHDRDRGWRGVEQDQRRHVNRHRVHADVDSKYQDYVDRRQARQHLRIEDGWRTGELTRKEVKRLRKNQRRIARLERKFTDDGYYSRRERQILRGELDDASARIYRKKHNDRCRVARHRERVGDFGGELFGLWSDGVGFVWYDSDS